MNKRGMDTGVSIIIMLFFVCLFLGIIYAFVRLPAPEPLKYAPYALNISQEELNGNGIQFYPNMRYAVRDIEYRISPDCDESRRLAAETAFSTLAESTILDFHSSDTPLINITCSDVMPTPEQKGFFVAGEGGPERIIEAGKYYIIVSGKVSLFRPEKCKTPQVATHEILHALGFDHTNETTSIMFPVTGCEQTVDQKIIDEINRIYADDTLPDLAIENVTAVRTGKYLNFSVTIANIGLAESNEFFLEVYVGDSKVDSYDFKETEAGTRQLLKVDNLRLPSEADNLMFFVKHEGMELSEDNNVARLESVREGD